MLYRIASLFVFFCFIAQSSQGGSYLVKFDPSNMRSTAQFTARYGGSLELVSEEGRLFKWENASSRGVSDALRALPSGVEYIQKNHPIQLFANPSLVNALARMDEWDKEIRFFGPEIKDNPDIEDVQSQSAGADPMLSRAWGMAKIKAPDVWPTSTNGRNIVVAVTDTGVDYNHKDLNPNMWRNPGEIPGDGIDNDNNGFIDDVVGWDFISNDNKPFDLTTSLFMLLFTGGNPGHGTHCAGVVGAKYNNGLGASGVAPETKIMALRILSEKGQGDTAAGVAAVDYAVKNGANIISASWGSMGEEEGDTALREAIQRAEEKGVLFVAAAGNGRAAQGASKATGYDNDTDKQAVYPASYPNNNIIAVAALDDKDQLAEFSNFGAKTVDIGAPGVKILSTVPGNQYQDSIIDFGPLKVSWDGTSMATPFVAGAAAVLWSEDLHQTAARVKERILETGVGVSALSGKVSSGSRLTLK